MKAFQTLTEPCVADLKMATCAEDNRLTARKIENPLIVLQQRAGLHLNHTLDVKGRCHSFYSAGKTVR